ncbi:hypothetical protein DASC09_005600 [Saccharomycopsis crataegensis]|uniref:Zn(2)-C6 fungal-type domain-containing protein n=1 Tax=Saccharomycopsis crataegensis TaxID=43959 RepID=A0AAV5QE60_9ASCO|nr:hypothetical protein DASC09_005600 [Saccharomycopsis crataegensis]
MSSSTQDIRKLNPISCLNCKKSKRKCDRELPSCFSCMKRNKPCTYPGVDNRKPASHKYVKALLDRIQILEASLRHYTSSSLRNLNGELRSSGQPSLFSGILASKLPERRKHEMERKANLSSKLFEIDDSSANYTGAHYNFDFPGGIESFVTLNNIEKAISSRMSPSSGNRAYIIPQWQLNMADNGEVLFQGPTSLRFIPPSNGYSNVKVIDKVDNIEVFDEFHQEVFTWFFKCMKNSFPLIDRELFLTSINQAIEGNELGEYSSLALINSIVSFYYLYNGEKEESLHYKKLSMDQLDDQVETKANLTIVQTLILLSHIAMTEGRELQSSGFIASAVAAVSHLGLHVNCENLINEGKITKQEAELRDNVFWCCFFSDRARGIVLGMSPYMYPIDVSVDLPKKPSSVSNVGFEEYDTFKEAVMFQDLEMERAYYCFSSDFAFGFELGPKPRTMEEITREQQLIVSKALIAMNDLRKEMNSNARFINNKSMMSMQLEVANLTTTILLNQTLLSEPVIDENVYSTHQFDPQQLSLTCFTSAQKVIDLCLEYELTESLFLYRFIYSIYISCIIFLFNRTSSSPRIEKLSSYYVLKSINLLQKYRIYSSFVGTFATHLDKFRTRWFENDDQLAEIFRSFKP